MWKMAVWNGLKQGEELPTNVFILMLFNIKSSDFDFCDLPIEEAEKLFPLKPQGLSGIW